MRRHAPDLPAPDVYNMILAQTWLMALAPLPQEVLEEDQQSQGRVEVLPVQWRKHLTLDVSGCLT